MLLLAEMATFLGVVAPLPHMVRTKVFTFLSESPMVGKVAYALKITFMYVPRSLTSLLQNILTQERVHRRFVGILFVDALQRMFRITAEADAAKASGQASHDVRAETNFAARKF